MTAYGVIHARFVIPAKAGTHDVPHVGSRFRGNDNVLLCGAPMNLALTDLDPARQMHPDTLGQAAARGRLQGRRILVVGAGQRTIPEESHMLFSRPRCR